MGNGIKSSSLQIIQAQSKALYSQDELSPALNTYIQESTSSIFNCDAFLIRALSIYSGKAPAEFVGSWGWLRLWGAARDAGLGVSKAGSCAHRCMPRAHHGHARNSGRIHFLLICTETVDAARFVF